MIRWLLLLFVSTSCARAKDPIEPVEPGPSALADYQLTSQYLIDSFVYGGFGIVSLKPDGSPEHMGEALIWGGTALWALPCDQGEGISQSMARMIMVNGGALIRVNPLGEYEGGREVTLDGALGAFLGASRRVVDCGEADLWRGPLQLLVAFQDANGGRLHPNTQPGALFSEFKYLRDLLAWKAGIGDEPSEHRLNDLEAIVGAWAGAVQLAHSTGKGSDACYRVNLGMTSFLTAETLGRSISGGGRDQFCQNTMVMDIPTVDHWCGRRSILGYLDEYVNDSFEYRHQRCHWESPDGDGNRSPRLDRLVALVMAHGWKTFQR